MYFIDARPHINAHMPEIESALKLLSDGPNNAISADMSIRADNISKAIPQCRIMTFSLINSLW